MNAEKSWNLGPAIHVGEPGFLYLTSHRAEQSAGNLDVYRVPNRVVPGDG